ncbi:MAG: hypothetical protein QOJ83_2289 [Frankiales bacterium]|jgi:hypothetical protein|nr:hypothetical protein [Frankiales bacterium]
MIGGSAAGSEGRWQLGIGSLVNATTAVQVPGITGAVSVAAGWENGYAMASSGSVLGWGQRSSCGRAEVSHRWRIRRPHPPAG